MIATKKTWVLGFAILVVLVTGIVAALNHNASDDGPKYRQCNGAMGYCSTVE